MELQLESAIREAADRLGPAVVGVLGGWRGGSGTVVAPGRVLTSAHNLRHEATAVSFVDGRAEDGQVVGLDLDLDLAVIRVDTRDIAPVDRSANTDGVSIGRGILAMSNPGGRGLHVAPGFVSSVAGSFRSPRGRRVKAAIEHTAPLPRGSSGGPLIDLEGRLLAINSVRLNPGLVLAVPIGGSTADRIDALGRGERSRTPRLGVAVAPPHAARRLRAAVGLPPQDGVLVRSVQDGSPADRAGLAPGDLIVAAGGVPLERVDGLYDALEAAQSGGRLDLGIVRGTDERQVLVALGEK